MGPYWAREGSPGIVPGLTTPRLEHRGERCAPTVILLAASAVASHRDQEVLPGEARAMGSPLEHLGEAP